MRGVGGEAPLAREQAVERLHHGGDFARGAAQLDGRQRARLAPRDAPGQLGERPQPVAHEQHQQEQEQRNARDQRRHRGQRDLERHLAAHVVALGGLDPAAAGLQGEHAPLAARAKAGHEGRERLLRRRGRAHQQAPLAVQHLEGDLGLVVVAERRGHVVLEAAERRRQLDHDRRGDGGGLELARHHRFQHARRGGEAGVEELLGLVLARLVGDIRRRTEHQELHGDAAGEEDRADGGARAAGAHRAGGSAT